MFYQVFKSLDNPSSMFGLKGSYLRYTAAGLGIAMMIALIVGSITNGLIGIISFVALGAIVYMGVMAFQAKFTERERKKWFASRKLPDVVSFQPKAFSKLAASRLERAKKMKQKQT